MFYLFSFRVVMLKNDCHSLVRDLQCLNKIDGVLIVSFNDVNFKAYAKLASCDCIIVKLIALGIIYGY